MCDDDDGAPLAAHLVDSANDGFFAEGIEMGGRLIEDDDLGALCEGARQGLALALANRQANAAGTDSSVPSIGGGSQDGVEAGGLSRSIESIVG